MTHTHIHTICTDTQAQTSTHLTYSVIVFVCTIATVRPYKMGCETFTNSMKFEAYWCLLQTCCWYKVRRTVLPIKLFISRASTKPNQTCVSFGSAYQVWVLCMSRRRWTKLRHSCASACLRESTVGEIGCASKTGPPGEILPAWPVGGSRT